MLSIQEILDKTIVQRKAIGRVLDTGNYHPEDANLYDGLKLADQMEIKQTMDSLSLAEILMKGSTVTGASYLVAAKLHDTLFYAAKQYDICPLIGYMVGPWQGANLTVNIAKDGTYVPKPFVGGGKMAEVNPTFVVPATRAPIGYGIPIICGEDLNEDTKDYGLIQWHVEQAGKACGKQATELALAVLKTATDGDGTMNPITTATTDTTILAEILQAIGDIGEDEFNANTMVTTPEAWQHTLGTQQSVPSAAGNINSTVTTYRPPAPGYIVNYATLDTLFNSSPLLHDSADVAGAAFTTCITLVFDRNNSMLTGRKRWLEIKNYAEPVVDIAGAVVSFRQDSVTLYDDSICVITEKT